MSLRSVIDTMDCVYRVIEERDFKSLKEKTVIIALGSTGVGKSTMLNSLIYGPEALEIKKIERQNSSASTSSKKKNFE